MIKALCSRIYGKEQLREDLIQLNRLVKTEDMREAFLDEFYENESFYLELLDEEDPKIRKNAVKLLACVGDSASLEPLWQHYLSEKTRFLRADYLEAFKSFDMTPHIKTLENMWEEMTKKDAGDKHDQAESRKLRELIWMKHPPQKHRFRYPKEKSRLCFIVPRGTEEMAAQAMDAAIVQKMSGGFISEVAAEDFRQVIQSRVYQSLLFDFCPKLITGKDGVPDGKKAGAILMGEGLLDFLDRLHESNGRPYVFRVDVKGIREPAVKNRIAREVSQILEEMGEGRLVNDASHFEMEIRMLYSKRMDCRVFLKLYTLPDRRFTYRKQILPVSMQPSRAALMLAFAGKELKDDANVLDPFCGSGVLLIERARMAGYRSLYGLDIYRPALDACEANSRNAKIRIQTIQRDFSDFRHEYPFDEIVTDMPRKSENHSAEDIGYIYRKFFDRISHWMGKTGVILLYSEEDRLIRDNIKRHEELRLKGTLPLTASGYAYLIHYGKE